MPEVYIHMRDADVDRTESLNAVANADYDANFDLVGIEVLGAVRVDVDGVEVTPQASSAERSEEDLVEAVSRKLQQDFLLCIGPGTRKFIEDGQERIPLSLRECYDVACAAVSAYRQVVRGE